MHTLLAIFTETKLWFEKRFASLQKNKIAQIFVLIFSVLGTFGFAHVTHAEGDGQNFWDTVLMYIGQFFLFLAGLLSKLVIAVMTILIPIITYNDFSNNPVVDAGWAILRDTVNMFFVIVLIAVAFGTIFGYSKFQWQQVLPRLLGFAIIINFSRTLCGLMIDVGQVVMLTFANAIREIAAGNFVNMLGMGEVYSMSNDTSAIADASNNANATPASAFEYAASAFAALIMMFIVLCVMVIMLIFFMYRIVMLWILITISPLTWFVGGAEKVVGGKAYADWWNQFKCLVTAGPILTFFLWLTLVVGGSGNLSTGFQTGNSTETAGGFLTKAFEMPKLISFIIAIALLMAGLDQAQGACSNMPGLSKAEKRSCP